MRKIVLIVLFIVTVLNVCAQTQPSDTCGPCTLPELYAQPTFSWDGEMDTRTFIHTDCDTLNMREHGSQYLLPYSFSSTTLDIWESSWPGNGWYFGEIPKDSRAAMVITKKEGVTPDIYGDMCPKNAANRIWDFAQPYHTDTTINIIGVAAMMLFVNRSDAYYFNSSNFLFEIRDTTLNNVYRTYKISDFFSNPDWEWRSMVDSDSCYRGVEGMIELVPQYFEMFFDTSLYISEDFYVVVNMKNEGYSTFDMNYLVYSYAPRAAEERAPLIMGYDSVWASVDTIPYNTYGWHGFIEPKHNMNPFEEVTEPIGAFALFPILGVVADTTQTDTNSYLPQMTLEKYTYIFPNPANDVVNIASSFGMQSVEIYNIAGEKVEEIKDIKSKSIELNISKYAPSTYIARIHTKHGSIDKKFVKK